MFALYQSILNDIWTDMTIQTICYSNENTMEELEHVIQRNPMCP